MDKQSLFKRLTALVVFIFLLNTIASKFYWYSSIWWFDMPMHFMGGLFLGLLFIYLFSSKDVAKTEVLKILFWVLLFGIFWEFFELYFVNHIADNPFNLLDTSSDIFFDLAGGCVALVYLSNKIMNPAQNNVQLK
ncbi:MAG: hypothetical protein KBC06_00315 [Candidatus Pacebacteria bacterium]|nr:hypothetical protein [Candidatus Paceibacterota bacterium]